VASLPPSVFTTSQGSTPRVTTHPRPEAVGEVRSSRSLIPTENRRVFP
jgi:hypothetical protein